MADGKLNRAHANLCSGGNARNPAGVHGASSAGNGANTSFVNRIADTTLPLDEAGGRPVQAVEDGGAGRPRLACRIRRLPPPRGAVRQGRVNSAGLDLASEHRLASPLLYPAQQRAAEVAGQTDAGAPFADGEMHPVINPQPGQDIIVGYAWKRPEAEVDQALDSAVNNALSGLPRRRRKSAPRFWSVQRC